MSEPWHPWVSPATPGCPLPARGDPCCAPCPHSWVLCEHGDFRGRQWLLDCTEITNWLTYSGLQHVGSLYPIRQVRGTFGRGQGRVTHWVEPKTPGAWGSHGHRAASPGLGILAALTQERCHQLGAVTPDSCPPPWEWLPLW